MTNKIKVLYILHRAEVSGAEVVFERFLRENSLIDPVILMPSNGEFWTNLKSIFKVYGSRGLGKIGRSRYGKLWIVKLLIKNLVAFFEIAYICLKEKPAIIHANTFFATVYSWWPAKIMRRNLIWHMHDIFPLDSLEARICRFLGHRVEHIIAVSNAVRKQLMRIGIAGRKISVIYNGIDFDKEFNPRLYRLGILERELGIGQQIVKIGMIGLFAEWKGFHIFIEAAKQVINLIDKPVKFFIIGDSWDPQSEYKKYLINLVQDKGLEQEIFFLGRRKDIPSILRDLDIVIHASIWEDPLPTVVLEAMSMAKLVIASKIGGVPEMIGDGITGIMFEPGSYDGLTKKIVWAINNPEQVEEISKNARMKVMASFREGAKRKNIYELYCRLLHNGSC